MNKLSPNEVDLELLSTIGVSRETIKAQQQYIDELFRWQKKTNLVSSSTLSAIWTRHIADSLQLIPLLNAIKHDRQAESSAFQIVDLGSGGGLPVMPLALAEAELANTGFTAVESNHKKSSFLRQAARSCGCSSRIKVISSRIESALNPDGPADDSVNFADVITARALADLTQLLDWAYEQFLQNPKLRLVLHKGREYQSEIDESRAKWCFDLVEHISVVDSESRILEITNLSKIVSV